LRASWTAFLDAAPEGWGRLLLRVASSRTKRRRTAAAKHKLAAAF
jgi:hypothetical protein